MPEKILSDKETQATAWVEVRGDLVPGDCDIIAEITGGQLAKPTAVPQYEGGSFLYQYVKYIYDITLSNSAGETASGTVTATVGFSVKPFHSQPEAILFDSFAYSDELINFVAQQQTSPDLMTGCCFYDPDDLISDVVEEEILSYNASWEGQYQSVMAVAVIKDSLAGEDMDAYMEKLSHDWGLRESDMLFLVYNNGESSYWMANQAFFDYFNFDDYDGLQEILDAGYQADAGGDYESALKNFYSYLNLCYADVYKDLSGDDTILSDLLPISDSLELTYTSGAGAWQTNLILYSDGSFEGTYSDSDMGDCGESYPNGTVYLCSFIGHFSDITRVNDYTYSMTLASGDVTITTGGGKWIEGGVRNIPDEWVEDGVRYVPSGPVGLEQGTNFYLYTPDAPIGELPMDFLDWWPGFYEEYPPDTLSCYGLYNWDGGNGFFSYE